MARETWEGFRVHEDKPVTIDLELTPLSGVARDASVIAAMARRSSMVSSEIAVVRYDAKDDPTPLNVDRYTVFEDITSHQSFEAIVAGGSTHDNENLREYCRENVFIVKQDPGPDHWLRGLPSSATTVFRTT
jgi:hypothetical protein